MRPAARLAVAAFGGLAAGAALGAFAETVDRLLLVIVLGNLLLPPIAIAPPARRVTTPLAAALVAFTFAASSAHGALHYLEHLPLTVPGGEVYYDPDSLERGLTRAIVFPLVASLPMSVIVLLGPPFGGERARTLVRVAAIGILVAAVVHGIANWSPPDYVGLTRAIAVATTLLAILLVASVHLATRRAT